MCGFYLDSGGCIIIQKYGVILQSVWISVYFCFYYNVVWGLELNIFLEYNELCIVMKVFEIDLIVIQYKKFQIKGFGKFIDIQVFIDKGRCVTVER